MASFWYTPAKERLALGTLDWDSADIRLILVMSNTDADTAQDAGTITAIGTLDEYDGSGYSRATLTTEAVVRDDPNNRAELTASGTPTFGATVGAGTRQAVGIVVYQHIDGTPGNDLPVAYIDNAPQFPFNGNGGAINVTINAEGLLQIT